MHLFPAIDLRDGQVVRLTQGDFDRQTTYGSDPVEQARRFADAGATWLHTVDLDGARTGTMTHLPLFERICRATSLKVQVGGGVRTSERIDQLLGVGVERVVLGTAALENLAWFEDLVQQQDYRGHIVLGLDARGGKLAVSGWQTTTDVSVLEIAGLVSSWPLAAIVYTDIAVDCMMQGPNLEATAELARTTHVPVIASGGIATLDDLRALRKLPLAGAIVGRALYDGAFSVAEALAAFE